MDETQQKEAKQSAAEKAIELHIGTSSPDDTTKPSEHMVNISFILLRSI